MWSKLHALLGVGVLWWITCRDEDGPEKLAKALTYSAILGLGLFAGAVVFVMGCIWFLLLLMILVK